MRPDVPAAAARLAGRVRRTPVLTSRRFNEAFGVEAFFKAESFQTTGSFKFRGALNALLTLAPEDRAQGVLTFSSGNHGQALARAGRELGVSVTVVMPEDAPAVKREAVAGYGAEVVLYDRSELSREALGRQIADERGLAIIPPYDHPRIIEGAGTAAWELIQEAGPMDALAVCLGGGGLLAGSALAAAALSPGCRVYGCEPSGADDGARSFRSGRIEACDDPQTIADGARTPFVGRLNFEIIQELVADVVTVDDEELKVAVRWIASGLKIAIEPTGALAAAAVMQDRIPGRRIGILISGGNFDPAVLAGILAG
jgi:threonine dehydratase